MSPQREIASRWRECVGKHLGIRDQGEKRGTEVPGGPLAWALRLWEGVTWGALVGRCWEQFTMGQHARSAEIDASCLHRLSFPDGYACLSGTVAASGNLLLD